MQPVAASLKPRFANQFALGNHLRDGSPATIADSHRLWQWFQFGPRSAGASPKRDLRRVALASAGGSILEFRPDVHGQVGRGDRGRGR